MMHVSAMARLDRHYGSPKADGLYFLGAVAHR